MIKLDSPDLPVVARPSGRSAPIARLFRGDNEVIAPIARFDLYAHYQNPGFTPSGIATPEPDFAGIFFRLDLGATIADISSVMQGTQQFGYLADPLAVSLYRCWSDGTTLNLYGGPNMAAGDSLTVRAVLESTILSDEDVAGIYTVTVPSGFSCSRIEAQGMGFTLAVNPLSPNIGEFAQDGQVCTITSSENNAIADFSVAECTGVGTYGLPIPTLAIATFDLSDSGITYVDGIDFHGVSFVPALVPANPKSGDFFWRSPLLTTFLPIALLSSLQVQRPYRPYTAKNLSSVQYQGVV